MPDRGAVEYLNLLILERLSRKFDASCTLVKLCCTKHVQKMYNIFSVLIEVPDYNSSLFVFFLNEEEAVPLGGKKY